MVFFVILGRYCFHFIIEKLLIRENIKNCPNIIDICPKFNYNKNIKREYRGFVS